MYSREGELSIQRQRSQSWETYTHVRDGVNMYAWVHVHMCVHVCVETRSQHQASCPVCHPLYFWIQGPFIGMELVRVG